MRSSVFSGATLIFQSVTDVYGESRSFCVRTAIMAWKLFLLAALVAAAGAQTILDECGSCKAENCPSTSGCLAGVVKDKCGCCMVCGRLEGERCDNYTLPLPQKDAYGTCGDLMSCLMRKDLDGEDMAEALCVCQKDSPVCGSDGRTYSSVCRLRQESVMRSVDLSVAEWNPCESVPVITSAPENVTGHLHDDLALSCEARGFPIPSLVWEFESATGKRIKLPGDDQMIALQVRGGPEALMVSSWIQILKLRFTDAGTYTCTVLNKKGFVRASSTVVVSKARHSTEAKTADSETKVAAKNPPPAKRPKNRQNPAAAKPRTA